MPGSLASRYVRGWGRPGDTAVIALEGGFPVGAAWYRLFPASEPGYGFVDERDARARDRRRALASAATASATSCSRR